MLRTGAEPIVIPFFGSARIVHELDNPTIAQMLKRLAKLVAEVGVLMGRAAGSVLQKHLHRRG